MSVRIPRYRYHKARDCAVVTLAGRDHYLGGYDSPESKERYHRLVAEFLAAAGHPAPPTLENPLTVTELVARYWDFAKSYYVKNGRPTGELAPLKPVLRLLRSLYGRTPAADFSPSKLKAVREAMLRQPITRTIKVTDPLTGAARFETKVIRVGLTRRVVNKQVGRVKRVFAWAVAEELLPAGVHAALARVAGLKQGRSAAREKPRVMPVSAAAVEDTLPLLSPTVRAMVKVQRLTGCRPSEVVAMRARDIDRSGEVWAFTPPRHKTEHHNPDADAGRERVVFIGPQAREVLHPFLAEADGDVGEVFLFRPARRVVRAAPPRPPHPGVDHVVSAPARPPGRSYRVSSYRQAVRRACVRAGVPVWVPNQLRHLRRTEIRKDFGLEAARVCGGHREVGVTQLYAERDHDLARRVMAERG